MNKLNGEGGEDMREKVEKSIYRSREKEERKHEKRTSKTKRMINRSYKRRKGGNLR